MLAAGLAFGLAVMCDYEVLAWLVVTVITLSATLVRLGARGGEVRTAMVALTLPTVAALGLWVVFGLVLTGRPFSWLAAVGRDPLGTTPVGRRLPVSEALEHTTAASWSTGRRWPCSSSRPCSTHGWCVVTASPGYWPPCSPTCEGRR